jgi:iron complex outermembrane receptor protein
VNNQRKWLAAMGCMAIGAGTVPMAVAQQDGSDAIGLEEVVVTARKRTEALIEVPVAVSVLTSEDIQQRGIQNLQDVALFTPGLSYFDAIQNQLGTPVIRGLSQTNLNSPDRNVAVFYGGVYLSNLNATNLEILDVERIEVVKGPQSALYGRNAFNGAINYVPAAPTKEFKSTVTGTIGTDERYEAKLMVAGPISETFSGRIAVSYNSFDGTWENAGDPSDNIGGFKTKNVSACSNGSRRMSSTPACSVITPTTRAIPRRPISLPATPADRLAGRSAQCAANCRRAARSRPTRTRSRSRAR